MSSLDVWSSNHNVISNNLSCMPPYSISRPLSSWFNFLWPSYYRKTRDDKHRSTFLITWSYYDDQSRYVDNGVWPDVEATTGGWLSDDSLNHSQNLKWHLGWDLWKPIEGLQQQPCWRRGMAALHHFGEHFGTFFLQHGRQWRHMKTHYSGKSRMMIIDWETCSYSKVPTGTLVCSHWKRRRVKCSGYHLALNWPLSMSLGWY